MNNDPWPEERVERLRMLTALGWSGSQIGEALGLTRSAVIGKRARLGLSVPVGPRVAHWTEERRERLAGMWMDPNLGVVELGRRLHASRNMVVRQAAKMSLPPKPEKPRVKLGGNSMVFEAAPDAPLPKLREPLVINTPKAMIDLKPHECKWPIGEGESMLFCANAADGVYCEPHRHLGTAGAKSMRDLIRGVRNL